MKMTLKKRLLSLITILCVLTLSAAPTMAATTTSSSIISGKAISSQSLGNDINLLGTDSFSLYKGGTVRFFDSASIAVKNVSGFSTVKVTLSGNPNTQYRIRFGNSTYKFINADGSTCSQYTIVGGTMYIQIDPYTGSTNWVTATITS